jgi:hypothetical protein
VATWPSWLVVFRKLRQIRLKRNFVFELVLDYIAAWRLDVIVLHRVHSTMDVEIWRYAAMTIASAKQELERLLTGTPNARKVVNAIDALIQARVDDVLAAERQKDKPPL